MVRIQLDIPDERVAQLDAMMKETGITTRKELFNNALTLFEWAVTEKKLGHDIAAVDEDDKKLKHILMPTLEAVEK